MPRKKLKRFAEIEQLPHVVNAKNGVAQDWVEHHFARRRPLTLELACGWGEYTIALGRHFPKRNFVGVDIKGERLWKAAKIAQQEKLENVAFLRAKIEDLASCFPEGSIDEIWITFPDPYPKTKAAKHRLTSERFLEIYRSLLGRNGQVHLKTDDDGLFEFTLENLANHGLHVQDACKDIYASHVEADWIELQTRYEKRHLAANKTIKYIRFAYGDE